MATQTGAIYGTTLYGDATYGQPLDLVGTTLPTFSVAPVKARPLDYETIQVSWTLPTTGKTIRLVRNAHGVSADENDGAVLLEQGITDRPVFIDDTLSTNYGGSFFYYTVWNEDANSNWWRAGDVQAILPKDWGYRDLLVSLIPSKLIEDDDALFYASAPQGSWSTLQNQTWF